MGNNKDIKKKIEANNLRLNAFIIVVVVMVVGVLFIVPKRLSSLIRQFNRCNLWSVIFLH